MNDSVCKNCRYFYQHYSLDNQKIFRVYCGHCTFSYPRKKVPDAPACDHFSPGESAEKAFISKEYLNNALLQYILNLEPLPEIKDLPAEK